MEGHLVFRGAPIKWLRGPARYEEGWIILERADAEVHDLASLGMAALFDLVNVSAPDQALRYARDYGLLRHADERSELRELFEQWRTDVRQLQWAVGGYLALHQAAAGVPGWMERVREVAKLSGENDVDVGDDELLLRLADTIAHLTTVGLEATPVNVGVLSHINRQELSVRRPRKRTVTTDVGLPEVFRDARRGPTFAYVPRPPHLLAFVYHMFSRLINDSAPLGQCGRCGRYFERVDARQRYCSRTCSQNQRWRNWTATHSAKGRATRG